MSMNFEGPGASYSPHLTSLSPSLPTSPPRRRQAHDVFEKIMKGRKSWKTLRDGDLVWPEELERALVEGLEAYQPDDSRETRILGRFPRRNRFISDYIFKVTGKRRTAKQVGSRLQQLRETSGGKELLSLLCPPHSDPTRASSSPRSFQSESSTPTSPASSSIDTQVEMDIPEQVVVSIYLIPPSPYDPPNPGRCGCTAQPGGTPSSPYLSEQQWPEYQNRIFRPSLYPRHILCIDPNISFTSLSKLDNAVSYFQVMVDQSTVHEEMAPLISQPASVPTHDGRHQYLYSTPLVPTFWQTLCQSSDPTRYTISHQVASSHHTSSRIYFSAVYQFSYPATASPPTTASSPVSAVPSDCGSGELPYSISRRSDRSSTSQSSYNAGTCGQYAGSGHGEDHRHTSTYAAASYAPSDHSSLSNNLLPLQVFGF